MYSPNGVGNAAPVATRENIKARNDEAFVKHVAALKRRLALAEAESWVGEITLTLDLKDGRIMRREIGSIEKAA